MGVSVKWTLQHQAQMEYMEAKTRAEQQAVCDKYNLSPQWERKFQRELWLTAIKEEYQKARERGRNIDLTIFKLDEVECQNYGIHFDISSFKLAEEEIKEIKELTAFEEEARRVIPKEELERLAKEYP